MPGRGWARLSAALSVSLCAGFDVGAPFAVPAIPARKLTGEEALLSFSAPFDTVNTYTGERFVHDWEVGGAAMVHRNFARLTSDAQGHRGWLSNALPFAYPSWSLMLQFRVSGANAQLYGDGLALWFVKNPEHVEGEVFGREDRWSGLGVFFDTFQNLDKAHHHKHPYVSAVLLDGQQHYEPQEGKPVHSPQRAEHVIPGREEGSGCSFDFRFSEERDDFSMLNGTWAHLVYSDGRLRLAIQQVGMGERWHDCIDLEAPGLEQEHYFGLSAATGDLVDNHDVLAFSAHGWRGRASQADIDALRAQALATAEARQLDLDPHAMDAGALLVHGAERVAERGGENASAEDFARELAGGVGALLDQQAAELQRLRTTVAVLQHRIEYELSAVRKGVQHAKSLAENGADNLEHLKHEVRAPRRRAFGVARAARAGASPAQPAAPPHPPPRAPSRASPRAQVLTGLSRGMGSEMERRIEDVTVGVKDQLEQFEKKAKSGKCCGLRARPAAVCVQRARAAAGANGVCAVHASLPATRLRQPTVYICPRRPLTRPPPHPPRLPPRTGGLSLSWWFLFVCIVALFGQAHYRYNKLMKSHFL